MKLTAAQQEQCARALFNFTWTLLEKPDRGPDDTELMIHAAHGSLLHWLHAGGPINSARGEWLLARVYAVAGRASESLHHARRCLEQCRTHGIGDFDLAFAHEALARAHAAAGDADEARRHAQLARDAGEAIADDEDRQHLLNELKSISA